MSSAQRISYSSSFFDQVDDGSAPSAEVIVPHVMRLIQPATVIDVGCGRGTWLAEFKKQGAHVVFGVDGEWVRPDELRIPRDCFRYVKLDSSWAVEGAYELAVCLEVAEHLPADAAVPLVKQLTRLAPAVLFSAALPGQGGTLHINEQWPEYWRDLFADEGYVRLDPIRRHVWQDSRVAYSYQQNVYVFVHPRLLDGNPELAREREIDRRNPLTLVYSRVLHRSTTLSGALKQFPGLAVAAIRRRLRWLAGKK
jgi:hypothetical protein